MVEMWVNTLAEIERIRYGKLPPYPRILYVGIPEPARVIIGIANIGDDLVEEVREHVARDYRVPKGRVEISPLNVGEGYLFYPNLEPIFIRV
jgi:hypothetical protein